MHEWHIVLWFGIMIGALIGFVGGYLAGKALNG